MRWHTDLLMYYVQDIDTLVWYFQYTTLWNVLCKELHMKVSQVHDPQNQLESFANLKNILYNRTCH
jgi:hypothetical protein